MRRVYCVLDSNAAAVTMSLFFYQIIFSFKSQVQRFENCLISLVIISAGIFHPNVLRALSLNSLAMSLSWVWLTLDK